MERENTTPDEADALTGDTPPRSATDEPPPEEADGQNGAAQQDGAAVANEGGEQSATGLRRVERAKRFARLLAALWRRAVNWLLQRRIVARIFGDYDLRWRTANRYWEDDGAQLRSLARVCPRGCSHVVVARRDLITKTTWSGRVATRVVHRFEVDNCAVCGSRLVDKCSRCRAAILAPVQPRCEACGLPQPWSPERLASAQRMRPRRWRDDDARDPAKCVYDGESGKLLILEGDVTNMAIDAIVSNDDVDGRMYTLIASAIRERAGQAVEDESMTQGPFPLGDAWFTDAGAITSVKKGIVHVAAMNRRGDTDLATIRKCVSAALDEAREQEIESLAIAAFGTGPVVQYRQVVTLEEWVDAVGAEIVDWFERPQPEEAAPLSVVVVIYEPENLDELEERLRTAARGASRQARDGRAPDAPPAKTKESALTRLRKRAARAFTATYRRRHG